MLEKFFLKQTQRGQEITVGDYRIVPVSRSYSFGIPPVQGGIIWNRPLAIAVERGDTKQIIPIHDATRRAQVAIVLCSILVTISVWLGMRLSRGSERTKGESDDR